MTPELTNPTKLGSGYGFTCALHDNGVYCWGVMFGETKPALENVIDLAVGNFFACALSADGTVKCWGNNDFASDVSQLNDSTVIKAYESTICGLKDNTVSCMDWRSLDSVTA